ncbi:MAG: hypothetical protein DME72_03955 [Verrucomicrobia bacterium]|nr:MAG: hypothetical protein DME72_03955 [Verrucomicrobiota bacterium]
MQKIALLLLAAVPLSFVSAGEELIPTAPGTGWRYKMTEEPGKGLRIPNSKTDATGAVRVSVLYRIANTDLLSIDEHGIVCPARINLDGELIKLNPSQTIVATPIKRGVNWNFDGQIGEMKVHQHYEVAEENDIEVPAGEFHAFHIHGEQTSPSRMTIDRWFAIGTGIVKDVTAMRDSRGDLLERISLELMEQPQIMERPEVKSAGAPKKISVDLAKRRLGVATTTFSSDTPQIYARWRGDRLRKGAKVRAVWIAENIGEDFPRDYKVDEATAITEGPVAHGAFTLSRPEDGWALGDYHVEFYVDDVLVNTVKLKIVK